MRLTIFDGIDMMASVAGAVLAPIIKNKCGLYACFGLKCGVDLLSLVYGFLYIEESKRDTMDPIECAIKRTVSIVNKSLQVLNFNFSYNLGLYSTL